VGDTLHVDIADTPGGAAVVWTPLGKGAGVYMATIACQ
jgi:hypothetical protein